MRLHAKDINSVDAASATVQLQLTVYVSPLLSSTLSLFLFYII